MAQEQLGTSVSFGLVTRGSGEVYVEVSAGGLEGCPSWGSKAFLAGGEDLPSRILPRPGNTAILCLPVLKVPYTAQVFVHDGALNRAQGRLEVDPLLTKRRSQLNTILKKPGISSLRNADRSDYPGKTRIEAIRLQKVSASEDLLSFDIICPLQDRLSGEPFEVRVLDCRGRSALVGGCILLGGACLEYPLYPGCYFWKGRYSCRISPQPEGMLVWARSLISTVEDGFETIQDFEVGNLRNGERPLIPAEYDEGYGQWLHRHRTLTYERELERMAEPNFAIRPLFTIVMFCTQDDADAMGGTIASVLAQTYSKFELLLATYPGDEFALDAYLDEEDGRVRPVSTTAGMRWADVAGASLDGDGDSYVMFLSPGDTLDSSLMYRYVAEINEYPGTCALYCDEDGHGPDGRIHPFLKPDFDSIYLESKDYLGHTLALRGDVFLNLLPGFPEEPALSRLVADAMHQGDIVPRHISRVLFHGGGDVERPGFPVSGGSAQDAAANQVTSREDGAVLLVTYGPSDTGDDGTRLARETRCAGLSHVHVKGTGADVTWMKRLREAILQSECDYLVMADASLVPEDASWLGGLLAFAKRPLVGVVAPRLAYPDNTTRNLGLHGLQIGELVPLLAHAIPGEEGPWGLSSCAHQVPALDGGCLVVPKPALVASKWLDMDVPGSLWNASLCLSLRDAGFMVVLNPAVSLALPLSADELLPANEAVLAKRAASAYLVARWPEAFVGPQPFYNQQLKLDGCYGLKD